jgi:hypothetical protein
MITIHEFLEWLGVLLIPLMIYIVRIESRLTKLETLITKIARRKPRKETQQNELDD